MEIITRKVQELTPYDQNTKKHDQKQIDNVANSVKRFGWQQPIVLGRQDYQWKHEPCLYGWKDGSAHYWAGGRKERTTITGFDLYELRNMSKEELLRFIDQQWCDGEDGETTVLFEEKPSKNTEHPTMKPVKLIARQIKNSTTTNDIVLDLFGGSGTTMIACEQLNRRCFMMEFDPKYADVIIDRWEKLTGSKAVLLSE